MYHIHSTIYAGVQILWKDAGKTTDIKGETFAGNGSYILLLSLRRYGKTGFENVYAEFIKLPCNFEFLLVCKRYARCLFTVAQCSVKNSLAFVY